MKFLVCILVNIFVALPVLAVEIPVTINITSKSSQDIKVKVEFRKLSMSENDGTSVTIDIPSSTYNNSTKDFDKLTLTRTVNIPSDYNVYQVSDAAAQSRNDFVTETMHGNFNNTAYFSSTNNTKLIQTSDILFGQNDSNNLLSGNSFVQIKLNITGCGDDKIKNIRIEHSSSIEANSSIWDYCNIL